METGLLEEGRVSIEEELQVKMKRGVREAQGPLILDASSVIMRRRGKDLGGHSPIAIVEYPLI